MIKKVLKKFRKKNFFLKFYRIFTFFIFFEKNFCIFLKFLLRRFSHQFQVVYITISIARFGNKVRITKIIK